MKKIFTPLIISLALISSLNARDIYVSTSGSDTNPGTEVAPYRTIYRASIYAMPGDVVYIREGVYEETLVTGRSGQPGNPITFMAYPGERVVITAMEALSGWELDEGSVYKVQAGWNLGQLNFVLNGETACDLARWPNNDDQDAFTLNSLRNTGGSDGNTSTNAYLDYSAGIPDFDWSRGGSVFFYCDAGGSGWTAWKAYIKSSTSTRVTFDLQKSPDWIRSVHPPSKKGDFYLEGIREAIDYDNEWYFDESSNTLYMQIPGGGQPADGQISLRKRQKCIDLGNQDYIHVKNITTLGGSITMGGTGNYLYGVYAYYGSMTRGVVSGFSSNEEAVHMSGSNNTVEKCEIAYGSGTGIRLEGNGNVVLNSSIHDFTTLGNYDAPINMRNGRNSKLLKNTIFRGGRDCVQMFNYGTEIAYNDISRSNLIADDCGLLYTVGGPYNMKIHHNWLHDTRSRGNLYKAAGIYLDNDAEDFLVHHNVVWNTEWSSIQINLDGKDIDVFHNTLWDASGAMGAWHREGTSFSNVRVWNNMADNSAWEPQSDKQNNLTEYGDPFVDFSSKNFQLKSGAQAVDHGRVINGITGSYYGDAPDVGAYEQGGEHWTAGIDWDPTLGPDHCAQPMTYLEYDGMAIVEAEHVALTGKGWSFSADGQGYLGEGYLMYNGSDHSAAAVDSTTSTFRISISNLAPYSPSLRVKGEGVFWLKTSEMASKVSIDSPDGWTWVEVPAQLLEADTAGIYEIHMSGGSPGLAVDRLSLWLGERSGIAMEDHRAESDSWCGDKIFKAVWASPVSADVTRTDAGFVIDGVMEDEWLYSDTIGLHHVPNGSEKARRVDLSAEFRLAYDADGLYVFVNVRDDHVIPYTQNTGYGDSYDHALICFNPDRGHEALGRYGEDAFPVFLVHGQAYADSELPYELASSVTDEGYILEAHIPWSLFPENFDPGTGASMGLEVQVFDADQKSADQENVDQQSAYEKTLAWANDTRDNLALVDTRKFGSVLLEELEIKYAIRDGWEVIFADSEEMPGSKELSIDDNPLTHWWTVWRGSQDPLPHEIQIDFHEELDVKDLHLLPRQDAFGPNGSIGEYEVYISNSTEDWGSPDAFGTLDWGTDIAENYKMLQVIPIHGVSRGRYMKIVALSEAQNDPEVKNIAISEINVVEGTYTDLAEISAHEHALRIWPNPSKEGNVRLALATEAEEVRVEIWSGNGRLMDQHLLGTGQYFSIPTGGLSTGMYFLRVFTDRQNHTEKLIIQ